MLLMVDKELETIFYVLEKNANEQKRQDAVLQLLTIIERSNYDVFNAPASLINLSETQAEIVLSLKQQREVAIRLIEILVSATNFTDKSSILWIIGKIIPDAMLDLLIDYLFSLYETLDNNSLYQGLISLENGLIESELNGKKLIIKNKDNLLKMLRNLANSLDAKIQEIAVAWAKKLELD